jgi:hypothetical protein
MAEPHLQAFRQPVSDTGTWLPETSGFGLLAAAAGSAAAQSWGQAPLRKCHGGP